jgi:two-component system phosphate regulon response regulator PhoB
MAKEHVLAVEDEEDIQELITYNLQKEGYMVTSALSGEDALKKARAKLPELVLLDLMLPGMDGLEVCKILRNDPKTAHIPIIMLTAKGEEADIVTGLEIGADDYIVKPFSPRVLLARMKAVLRRNELKKNDEQRTIRIRELMINPSRREVLVKNNPVDLTYTEFQMLHFLASRPGRVYTRYQIIDAVRGTEYAVTDRSVDVQITGLRRKLGACGKYIETVRGVGYRFKD